MMIFWVQGSGFKIILKKDWIASASTGIRVRSSTLQNHSKKEPLYPRGMLVLPSALKEPLTPPALGLVSRERHVPE